MTKQFVIDALGWGFGLWLFGYILGILFFGIFPASILGWAIMPFGVAFTLWVLFKKIKTHNLSYFIGLGTIWTILAIILDYFLLVQIFKPVDGYYKLDVYLYYIVTFILPILIGQIKLKKNAI